MEIAHPLDVDQVFLRSLPDLLGSPEGALAEDVSDPFPPGDAVDQFDNGIIVPPCQFQSIGILIRENSLFVQLEGPCHHGTDLKGVQAVVIYEVVCHEDGVHVVTPHLSTEGSLARIFRPLGVRAGIGSLLNNISMSAVDLAAEAPVETDGDLIDILAFDILSPDELVELEVAGPNEPRCIGHPVNEHGSPPLHDLGDLGGDDLIDDLPVILQGFLGVCDLDIQRPPDRDGLEVFRAQQRSHPRSPT